MNQPDLPPNIPPADEQPMAADVRQEKQKKTFGWQDFLIDLALLTSLAVALTLLGQQYLPVWINELQVGWESITNQKVDNTANQPQEGELVKNITLNEQRGIVLKEGHLFQNETGELFYQGLIQNTSLSNVGAVQIKVDLMKNKEILISGSNNSAATILAPNELSTFSIALGEHPELTGQYQVAFNLGGNPSEQETAQLKVIPQPMSYNGSNYIIQGVVTNVGEKDARGIVIMGVLLDTQQGLIGVQSQLTEKETLPAGASVSFTITFDNWDQLKAPQAAQAWAIGLQ